MEDLTGHESVSLASAVEEQEVREALHPQIEGILESRRNSWTLWKRLAISVSQLSGESWEHHRDVWKEKQYLFTIANFRSAIVNMNKGFHRYGLPYEASLNQERVSILYEEIDNNNPVPSDELLDSLVSKSPVLERVLHDLMTERVYEGREYVDYDNKKFHDGQSRPSVSINNVTLAEVRRLLNGSGIALREKLDDNGLTYFTIDSPTRGETLTNFGWPYEQVLALLEFEPSGIMSAQALAVGLTGDSDAIEAVYAVISLARRMLKKSPGGSIVTHKTQAGLFYELRKSVGHESTRLTHRQRLIRILKQNWSGLEVSDLADLVYTDLEMQHMSRSQATRGMRSIIRALKSESKKKDWPYVIGEVNKRHFVVDLTEKGGAKSQSLQETLVPGRQLTNIEIVNEPSDTNLVVFVQRKYLKLFRTVQEKLKTDPDFIINLRDLNESELTGMPSSRRSPIEKAALDRLKKVIWQAWAINDAAYGEVPNNVAQQYVSGLPDEAYVAYQELREVCGRAEGLIHPDQLILTIGFNYEWLKLVLGLKDMPTMTRSLIENNSDEEL